jgi:cobalt-zinc-cadmium efflux system outer membrane protein
MLLSACVAATVAARPDAAAAADNESLAMTLGAPSADQLTLTEALAITLANNPELAAARAAVAASEADARQAGSFVNPELSLEVENFAGSEELSDFDGAETTLRLDQTIELGGKRAQRRASGSAAQAVAVQQQHLTRAELYARTVEAFMGVLAAQERWQLAEIRLQLATKTFAGIEAQIEAGKSPTIAGIRSRPLLIEAGLELDRASGELHAARQTMASLLGVADAASLVAQGDLAALPEVPEPDAVESTIPAAPQLALAAAARDQAAQELAGEKLRAIPDVTLGLGVRRFEEGDEHALVAGLSVPLPLFDRNRNGIAAAVARLEQARSAVRNTQLSTRAALAQAVQELRASRDEARALQDELLPAAQQSFAAVEHGYRAGKFGLLDLLDTQRQLSEVQSRLLSAQVDCHVAAARLDALLGRLPLAATGATP